MPKGGLKREYVHAPLHSVCGMAVPQLVWVNVKTGGWTLEGDASEQLEALFKQEQEDKLSDPQADVLELCRERWQKLKRTTRGDVVQHCDAFKTKDGSKDRKALRTLRSLEGKGLLESKAETTDTGTEIAFKPTE